MKRTSRLKSVLLTWLVAVLAIASQTAQAQVTKPFKVDGQGVAPEGLLLTGFPHGFVGNATHLGKYYGEARVQIDSFAFNLDGSITGMFESDPAVACVFVGANGDKLVCDYGKAFGPLRTGAPGTYRIVPLGTPGFGEPYFAEFIAEFVPTAASTGKFEGVKGSWVMYAVTGSFLLGTTTPVPYEWHGEGSLTFKKGK